MQAAELCEQHHLAWQPWKMGVVELSRLNARKPITEQDRQRLISLMAEYELPSGIAELARWMLARGEKGDQEGYL